MIGFEDFFESLVMIFLIIGVWLVVYGLLVF